MSKYILFIASALGITLFASCSKDDHNHSDHEVITHVELDLINSADTVRLRFIDLDGDGGNAPVITGGTLKPAKTYQANIRCYRTEDGVKEEMTQEILSEGLKHQFFFITSISGLSISYLDKDSNNNPIGLKSQWVTTSAGSGNVQVVLRHELTKSASGVSSGNIQNAGGETDIEIDFNVSIQ